ncbi:MAG TPA: NAD-dependent epimerase/dehydratase family protein [Gemmatimonadaceae bacterium]|nr:NAD-dependent epimerase/dehydratase family protein [Gemmatimonadaceae bacterium]
MRVFVTGAASPLGRVLTQLLLQRGDAVVCQVRRRSAVGVLQRMGAEPVRADLSDSRRLSHAMDGCERLYHLAQFFDFWAPSLTTFHDINVFGTENAMAAALTSGVRRAVVCSTALTIEERPADLKSMGRRPRGHGRTAYERSAVAAETLALRFRARGMEVVIANPALVLAPSDPGWIGRLVASQVSGLRRSASKAPMGWISVLDTAHGIIRAADVGRSGARYTLCADTLSAHELLTHVARLAGKEPPQPSSPALTMAHAYLSTRMSEAFGRRPSVSIDEARFTNAGFCVDGADASLSLELNYTPLNRYLPGVVASYRKKMRYFAR